MTDLPTYTVPDEVYASFFHSTVGTIIGEKRPLPTALESYPSANDLATISEILPISTTVYFPALASATNVLDTPFLDDDSVSVFTDAGAIQTTDIPISLEAQNFPVFTTLTPQPSYSAVAQAPNDSSISPITIIGLATGGAISIMVALAITVLMCTRRRRSGRYRQNSVAGSGMPMEITAPLGRTEPINSKEQVHELSSSLKTSPSNSRAGSSRSRYSKHITWKDQVFSDQSFITLPPLPPHPASISLPSFPQSCFSIGEGAQEPDSSRTAMYLPPRPDNRISYRSFSSPTLGADCTSIYSSVPPSPVCVSALSPIPSYLFPASYHQFQRSPIPSSQYNPTALNSSELKDYYTTITCTGIYSFLPSTGRRSPSDSLAIQETNPPNPPRKSLIQYSSNIQAFHHSFSYPKSPGSHPKLGSYVSQTQVGGNRLSAFVITEDISNDSDSISSVSSTSSSILNYRIGGTPRKTLAGGLLAVDSSSPLSSENAFDDSPPSGGLTSPSRQTRYPGRELRLQTSPLSSCALDDSDSPQAPGSGIGVALSSSFFGTAFIASPDSERVSQDVFLDTSDSDTYSPTLEEISTRHFSCSMSTRPRSANTDSSLPPYPQVIPPSPTHTTILPDFCGRDSPTLPRDLHDPSIEAQDPEYDTHEMPPKFSRRMHDGVESTYSPTLSMVNFYSIGSHTDDRFSSVNFFTPFSSGPSPNPYHTRSSSVPALMSPIINCKNAGEDENRKRGSIIEEYPPNLPKRLKPLSVALDTMGRIGVTNIPDTHDRVWGKKKRHSSQLSLVPGGDLIFEKRVDDMGVDGEEQGGVDLEETKIRRAESID